MVGDLVRSWSLLAPCRSTTLLRSGFDASVTSPTTFLALSATFETVFSKVFSTVATGLFAATTRCAATRFDCTLALDWNARNCFPAWCGSVEQEHPWDPSARPVTCILLTGFLLFGSEVTGYDHFDTCFKRRHSTLRSSVRYTAAQLTPLLPRWSTTRAGALLIRNTSRDKPLTSAYPFRFVSTRRFLR